MTTTVARKEVATMKHTLVCMMVTKVTLVVEEVKQHEQ